MPLKLHRQGYDNLHYEQEQSHEYAELKSTLYIIKDGHSARLDTLAVDQRDRVAEFEYRPASGGVEYFTLEKDQLEQLDWFSVRAGWFGKDDVELVLIAPDEVTFRRADIKKVKE